MSGREYGVEPRVARIVNATPGAGGWTPAVGPDSRYAGIEIDYAPLRSGGRAPIVMDAYLVTGGEYQQVVLTRTKTFHEIATEALGDPTQWWRIADLNPGVPGIIVEGGSVVRVPLR